MKEAKDRNFETFLNIGRTTNLAIITYMYVFFFCFIHLFWYPSFVSVSLLLVYIIELKIAQRTNPIHSHCISKSWNCIHLFLLVLDISSNHNFHLWSKSSLGITYHDQMFVYQIINMNSHYILSLSPLLMPYICVLHSSFFVTLVLTQHKIIISQIFYMYPILTLLLLRHFSWKLLSWSKPVNCLFWLLTQMCTKGYFYCFYCNFDHPEQYQTMLLPVKNSWLILTCKCT